MIKIFDGKTETNFRHCKNVLTDCKSAYLYEYTDGRFFIELEYPADGKNADMLVQGNILSVPSYDERENQLFVIRKPSKNLSIDSKSRKIYADCIGYADADTNYIPGIEIKAGNTRKQAMQQTLSSRADKRRKYKAKDGTMKSYEIGNKDTSVNTNVNLGLEDETGNIINYVDMADKSLLKCFLEDATDKTNSSISKAYGGEIIWDNFTIDMVDERGNNQEFLIKSGKNLMELDEDIDETDRDNFATALIMKSSDGLFLPNQEIIYASNANKFDRYYYKTVTCDDVSLEDLVTENTSDSDVEKAKQIVYEQLRERAQKLFNNGLNILSANYTVKAAELENTEEFKDRRNLIKRARLGNNVKTLYINYGINSQGRITGIKANLLRLNKENKATIEEVEIGKRKNIFSEIKATSNTANTAKTTATEANTNAKRVSKDLSKTKRNITVKFEEYDEGLRAMVTEEDMWSLIQMNPGKILLAVNDEENGTDVIINVEGLEVHKGKFRMFDMDDNVVLVCNNKGSIVTSSAFCVADGCGTLLNAIYGNDMITFSNDSDIAQIAQKGNGIDIIGKLYINGQSLKDYIKDVVG